ncbi:MAG: transcription elongation factor GreA [Phycisphaeraceae bacterium]|nr:transcription elongation factor GreA [Phycisphaeraceae bacterium]
MEFITPEEKQSLEQRLTALVANRPVISQRIAEARALGDLKENGDYHAAREEQGMQEAEIQRLQERLTKATVIDPSMQVEGVVFVGATVRIIEVGTDDEELVRLVGEATTVASAEFFEATLGSPFGEALHKARVGEEITVRGPRGDKRFRVLEIL